MNLVWINPKTAQWSSFDMVNTFVYKFCVLWFWLRLAIYQKVHSQQCTQYCACPPGHALTSRHASVDQAPCALPSAQQGGLHACAGLDTNLPLPHTPWLGPTRLRPQMLQTIEWCVHAPSASAIVPESCRHTRNKRQHRIHFRCMVWSVSGKVPTLLVDNVAPNMTQHNAYIHNRVCAHVWGKRA